MKNYLEVADDVFQKGDECLKQKRERKEAIKNGVALAALTAVVLFSAFGITKGLLPRKVPVALPASFDTTESATTAHSGETISNHKTESAFASTQEAAPGTRTTNPGESGNRVARAAQSGTEVSGKPSGSGSVFTEASRPDPDKTNENEPTSASVPAQTPTEDVSASTEPSEPVATEPTDPGESSLPQTIPSIRSTSEPSTRRLSPGAPSYNAEGMLRAALEDNAFAWIKYNDRYYIHDSWTNADGMEFGEKLGEADDFEGNLELLDLSGEVFRLENGEGDACLMLKTSDGQNMVFILNPAGD